jgi:predicted  nucleic acid-binding Zn-ribbon protein
MELGVRELMTIATVLSGLAATWGLVRGQIARLLEDLTKANDSITTLYTRLDQMESSDSVQKHQIRVIASMLSPEQREQRARELESLQHKVSSIRRDCDTLMSSHNGSHPYIPPPAGCIDQ